jgi:hypothetical protein
VNEEEAKIKYVLPWLAAAGVDPNELTFERSFSVRIGRQAISIAASRSKDNVSGRLDILVRRGDKNLFIVETKAADIALADDDRDQAISYARLVHPIAPFAVVTNGGEYRLYDSITKERINPSEIRIRGFEAALPEADIAEAQRSFLALNRTNLLLFCQSQVAGQLRLVKGTVAGERKYVPELHVPRQAILDQVAQFFGSNSPGLLFVGQSGSGKTCELCSITESLLASGKPVLFFNGFSLEKNILDAIANEFSWTFSGSHAPIDIVKRMESLVQEDFLTIIVDAIDEWSLETRSNHLAAMLEAAERQRIRFVLSCKTSAVEQFLAQRGNPTSTSLLAKRVDVVTFSPREFFHAVDKYRRAYQFFGGFEDVVLSQARENPFLLRVLFDVARKSNARHLTFSSSEFFATYFEGSIRKTSDWRQAEETLSAIACLLYERNVDVIPEADARASLGLRVNEPLMDELFEYGILLRSVGDGGERAITFYFQQLRDYIIAFRALHFSKMTPATLEAHLRNVKFPSMQGDVFTLYYRLASKEHKLVFDSELRENAAKYLDCYRTLIRENFAALKGMFRPGTEGRVGFIGELLLSRRRVGAYGFRPIGENDDEVYFVPVQQVLGRSNLAYLSGGDELHLISTSDGFGADIDVTAEVVQNELLPQLRLLVEGGRLNESSNPELLSELIVESVFHHKTIFKRLFTPDARTINFPLNLDAVLECLLRERLSRHFRQEIVDRRRRSGEIREVWKGTNVSYSYSPAPEDAIEISQNVERALASREVPPLRARYSDLEDLDTSVSIAVKALRAYRSEITEPIFEPLRQIERGPQHGVPMPAERLKVFLCKLYSAFLSNYKHIVESNFPTLRAHFGLYSSLPVSVYLKLLPERQGGFRYQTVIPVSVYFVRPGPGQSVVTVAGQVVWEDSEVGAQCTVDGVVYEGISWLSTSVDSLLANRSSRLAYGRFREMTLRSLVYSKLLEELPVVEDVFRSRLGVRQTSRYGSLN